MDRMNKDEIINLIDSLKLEAEDFIVLSSSGLVLRDLFESAGDLDLAINENGLNKLKENFDVVNTHDNWYKVNEKVECVLDNNLESKREKVGNYYLQDLEYYRSFLIKSDREKDKIRLEVINKALGR